MKLSKLLEVVDVVELRVEDPEVDISTVTEDSRKCESGTVFVAYRGEKLDGHTFIDDAIRKGASAIICESGLSLVDQKESIENIIRVPDGRNALAAMASRIAGEPSKQLRVIGVTGTNGKTTVVSLLTSMLKAAGFNAIALTTVGTFDGEEYLRESDLTTPDPMFLQKRLQRALCDGISHVCMEISSHSLIQKRIAHTKFTAGAFTNLTEDHLDFHGDMEGYEKAKEIFFKEYLVDPSRQFAVINVDDPVGRKFASLTGAQVITCSLRDDTADIYARVKELTPRGSAIELLLNVSKLSQVSSAWLSQTSRAVLSVGTSLPGIFNVSNITIATGLAAGLGVGKEAIVKAISSFNGVPGRMEQVNEGQNFTVYIDYAHTPDALQNVLETVHQLRQPGGRIILVMGNGGDRDRTKRPLCGEIGARLSDRIIVTNDNPRTENPNQIIADIVSGVPADRMNILGVIADRREAIRKAISEAHENDIVVIAGKGHEDYMIVGTDKIPFDDKREARDALRFMLERNRIR
jgi:UDP-N-acetylmuramoyl-L-alanyl-D-glutamate--2,6-diaminopimelate ligase